jgi:hypothetical protein
MTGSSIDEPTGKLRGLPDPTRTVRPAAHPAGGGRAAALALRPPGPWHGPIPRLTTPWSLGKLRAGRRWVARVARLGMAMTLLLGLALAASTALALLDRPSLPRNLYIFGPPLTVTGTSPGVTHPFELEAGEQRVEWYGWNEYGCRLDARLVSADGASVSVIARAGIGRARSGEVRLAALRAGTYRLHVESTCAWSITFHGA